MEPNAELEIARHLESGESLIWAGVPKQGLLLRPADAFMIPFSRCTGPVLRELRHGSQAECGIPVAALCCSLLESAKLVGVEPRTDLGEATQRAVWNPGTLTPCWVARYLKSPES